MGGNCEERLAVAISSPDEDNMVEGQFLASPTIQSAAGRHQSRCIVLVLQRYNIPNQRLFGMVTDTTANNLGKHNGSVILFERQTGIPLVYLPCRHHEGELHVKHASKAVRGPTKVKFMYLKCTKIGIDLPSL